MNFLKRSALITVLAFMGIPVVQANDEVTSLPTIRVMAESELREEVGFVPFQEDKQVRQSLQHYVYKVHNDMQNAGIPEMRTVVDYQPMAAPPDLSQFSPILQQYILAVASGFQSSDPTNGLFKMLEPLNLNRNSAEGIRNGTIKINVDDILRLRQQFQDGLRGF
ncbi:hypothetical protein GCM10025882_13000 [Acinetobacter gyllenbergii]|uniref:Peptide signal n=1 Tax=Acinetobacter gyllenbergii CIP 110306 = MTCC 11365 TaxID=1217657 RepID=A0A829HD60_9GAMM|nr:hypothetical protein [Acinetobacter gyllenbergii]EPF75532.1 hypothetical protein F957_03096 [Acinetobacter gyllenbergii CIP 110306 = MTCC 11365]EPH31919.1 putative peptide signal [Acinetobacter gyllenbergii CIP 110306 = MTCC 11365]ESK39430.1 hypothetical protein F987_02799 [Acinetobacter gyllenbergii NIPH 230]OBY73375.1 peptide signal protein [Acinetobacter gyllenbergii]GMA10875.1 hypothetical protein GCM10025882_13000 [Acinetobacter gyllenbergii]